MTVSPKPADHGADVREARTTSLHELGWNTFFDGQLSAEDRAGGLQDVLVEGLVGDVDGAHRMLLARGAA